MKQLITLSGAVLLLSACADNPVAPAATTKSTFSPGATRNLSSIGVSGSLDFSADLDGIRARVLPTLDDKDAALRIASAIDALSDHLQANDRAAVPGDIQIVRGELKPEVGNPADLASIELALSLIESSL